MWSNVGELLEGSRFASVILGAGYSVARHPQKWGRTDDWQGLNCPMSHNDSYNFRNSRANMTLLEVDICGALYYSPGVYDGFRMA